VTPETLATAIRIGDPASHDRAVRAIHESAGHVMMVSDEEIMTAKALVDRAGVGCEPASAATVAGVRRAREEGVIRAADSVVCVLTGHLLKDPEATLHYHSDTFPAPRMANPTVHLPMEWSEAEPILRDVLRRQTSELTPLK
jgi:threonine synthase